jgi:hypothetical protein
VHVVVVPGVAHLLVAAVVDEVGPEGPRHREPQAADQARHHRDPAAVLLASAALVGVGTSAAQAATDTFKVVFQDNDNVLAGYSNSGSNFTTTAGMKAGTSPLVALLSDSSYEAAFEINTDNLGTVHIGTGLSVNTTTLGIDAVTNPSITY